MSYLTHINRHDDLNYNEDFEEAIARNIKEEDYENNDSETEGSNSRTDTEDASETEEPPHKIQEEPVEIKEQIYQDKLANLKKQLEEVQVGSHPELIRRLKQLERQYHDRLRLNSYYRDYLIECVEKDYILEKNAAVKEYEEKKADLKENLLADFEDKKKMIESERTSMEIIESGEMRQTITRKLRRRPNDPVPVTEKRRKMGNGPASSLVFQLDEKEIEYDLKLISRGKSTINNNNNNSMRNYSQNSSLMNNSVGNNSNIMLGYNNDGHAVETRIEDGKLLYERRWYHRGQAVYIEVSQSSSANTLHIGTACFAKTFTATNFNMSEKDDVPLRINGNACGEDDFFVSNKGDINLLTLADGVGSWSQYGINPKIFTRELLKSINLQFKILEDEKISEHDKRKASFLLQIISKAYANVQRTKKYIRFGSCTLVALSLNIKTLHLNSYVLGDSGFMIIRNNRIVYRSKDLLHGFNFPYQLAFVPEHSNSPFDGFIRPFKLRVNDVIIIGSDGLFDNLFDDAILYHVTNEVKYLCPKYQKGYSEAARRIAKKLTVFAKRIGEIENDVSTPFSEEVNSLKVLNFTLYNGKNDDTTVISVIVS